MDVAMVLANPEVMEFKLSLEEARKSFINLGLGLTLPTLAIKPLTIATKAQKIIPRGFNNAEQYAQAGVELKAVLQKSSIEYSKIGVRGSSVTNVSSKSGGFRNTAIDNLKASDIDVYIEFIQKAANASQKGFIHPDKLMKTYPALKSGHQNGVIFWVERLLQEAGIQVL